MIRNGVVSEYREEKPYIGNVAVDESCRRLGYGSKLIRIAMKVAEKWKDDRFCNRISSSLTTEISVRLITSPFIY